MSHCEHCVGYHHYVRSIWRHRAELTQTIAFPAPTILGFCVCLRSVRSLFGPLQTHCHHMLSLSLRGRRGNRTEEKPLDDLVVDLAVDCQQTSKTTCLQVVYVRFGSFLPIHSTAAIAATGDGVQVLPQRSHVSNWWSAPQKFAESYSRETTESHRAPKHLCFFQDRLRPSKIWSTDFPRFSKQTLGRSWQWANSCALLSLDLASRRSSQPWHWHVSLFPLLGPI